MWRRTVWCKVTDVSEKPDAAIFEVKELDLANYLIFVGFLVFVLVSVLPGLCNIPWRLKTTPLILTDVSH
jgi:hypothetical protein